MSTDESSNSRLLSGLADTPKHFIERIASIINPHLYRLINKTLLSIHDTHSYIQEVEDYIGSLDCDESSFLASDEYEYLQKMLDKLLLISDLGEPEISLRLLSRLEDFYDRLLCDNSEFMLHFLKSSTLAIRANIADQAGMPEIANSYYEEVIEYRLQHLGKEGYRFVVPLKSNQACMHLCHGKLEDAEAIYETMPEDCREAYGKHSPYTIARLRMLGDKYKYIGRDDLVVRVRELSCLFAKESSVNDENLDLELQSEYGEALLNVGRFADAQECFQSSLEQCRTLGDSIFSRTMHNTLCNNLTLALWRQGLAVRADSLLSTSRLGIDKLSDIKNNEKWSNIDSTRVLLQLEIGEQDRSLKIAQRNAASAIKRIRNYWLWPDIACAYHNYGASLMASGQISRAISMYCISLRFFITSGQIASSLTTLNNLAFAIDYFGDREACKNILHFVLDMRNRYLEPNHPDISVSFGNLAYCCFKRNELSQSLYFCLQALTRETLYNLRRYSLLPSSLRLEALRRAVNSQHQIYEIACLDSSAITPAYWARIHRHGILQSVEKDQMQSIRSLASGDNYTKELALIYRELGKSNLNQDRRMHLLSRQEYLEKIMHKGIPLPSYAFVSVKTLYDAIPPRAILLEFVHINYAGQYHYRVFSLAQATESLTLDLIADAATLDRLVAKALFSLSNGLGDSKMLLSELSQALFIPLASRLKEVSQIYMTLDSSLHQVPVFALPHWQDSERLLCDDYSLTILTSSRDLLTRKADANKLARPVVVAATEYREPDLEDQGTTREAYKTVPTYFDSATRIHDNLPFAKLEAKAVASILNAELISESQATMDYLRSLQSPRILHLAAHGIYNGVDPAKYYDHEGSELRMEDALAAQDTIEFMRYSGIILAGGGDQGQNSCSFLSALDIAHLNLHGTELVVLSACDTGLVNVASGEGVYGLERALVVAGAHAMLLSLWAVPDAATCTFMVRYYTLLKDGASRADALVKVQQEFRVHRNIIWRDPYYWAAWQLIGDGGPIKGL